MHEIYGNCEIYERGMGASRYTPRVCCAAVWNGPGEDLPLGWLLLIGAPTETLIILTILITLISAARRV